MVSALRQKPGLPAEEVPVPFEELNLFRFPSETSFREGLGLCKYHTAVVNSGMMLTLRWLLKKHSCIVLKAPLPVVTLSQIETLL